MNQISVTFVNLNTRRRLGQAVVPVLPAANDTIKLGHLGYEVVCCDWVIPENGEAEITVLLRPQLDANGERPFSYPEEQEL